MSHISNIMTAGRKKVMTIAHSFGLDNFHSIDGALNVVRDYVPLNSRADCNGVS